MKLESSFPAHPSHVLSEQTFIGQLQEKPLTVSDREKSSNKASLPKLRALKSATGKRENSLFRSFQLYQ